MTPRRASASATSNARASAPPIPKSSKPSAVSSAGAALAGKATLVVDATGVGSPVVEMLRRAGLRATIMPVVITSGGAPHLTQGNYHVPRTELLSGLELLFEQNRLDIAASLPLWPVLKEELSALRRIASPDGRYRLVTAGAGTHDDLAVATALACWAARKASKP